MKSRDLSCDCLIGSTSRPYNNIGIHFVDTSWRITSSDDAIFPIFPKILLNARYLYLYLCVLYFVYLCVYLFVVGADRPLLRDEHR